MQLSVDWVETLYDVVRVQECVGPLNGTMPTTFHCFAPAVAV